MGFHQDREDSSGLHGVWKRFGMDPGSDGGSFEVEILAGILLRVLWDLKDREDSSGSHGVWKRLGMDLGSDIGSFEVEILARSFPFPLLQCK